MSQVAQRKGRAGFITGFLFAPLALYLTFVIWPYVQTFGYSFTNWSGQSPTFDFVGVDNYATLLSDEVFRGALWHNLLLLVFVPLVTILLALFFAFMVNAGGRGGAGECRESADRASTRSSTSSPRSSPSPSSRCSSARSTAATRAACSTAS